MWWFKSSLYLRACHCTSTTNREHKHYCSAANKTDCISTNSFLNLLKKWILNVSHIFAQSGNLLLAQKFCFWVQNKPHATASVTLLTGPSLPLQNCAPSSKWCPSTRRADEISHISGCRREGEGAFSCKRQIFAVGPWQWFQQYFSGNNLSSQRKLKNTSAEKQRFLAGPCVDKKQNLSWFQQCKLALILLIVGYRLFSTERV